MLSTKLTSSQDFPATDAADAFNSLRDLNNTYLLPNMDRHPSLFGSGHHLQAADASNSTVTEPLPEVTAKNPAVTATSSSATPVSPNATEALDRPAEEASRDSPDVVDSEDESKESSGTYHGSTEDNDVDSQHGDGNQHSRSPSVENESFPRRGDYGPKYEFRGRDPGILRSIKTSAIDQDQSGDYDPSIERKRVPPALKKRKRSRSPAKVPVDDDDQDGEVEDRGVAPIKRPRPVLSTLTARQRGLSFPVRIPHGNHSLSYEIVALGHIDNWPFDESHYNVFEQTALHNHSSQSSEAAQYRLRKRPSRNLPSNWFNDDAIPDPRGLHQDIANHPAARGCVHCRKEGHLCPLIKNPYDYPCHNCELRKESAEEPNAECELIIPAEKKRSCQSCRNRKIHCSYEADPGQAGPCDECGNGFCVAGPLPGTARVRYNAENLPPPAPAPVLQATRKYVACTECRKAKRRCSLKKNDPPPCRTCQATGDVCDFLDVRKTKPKPAAPAGAAGGDDAQEEEEEEEEEVVDEEDQSESEGDGEDEDHPLQIDSDSDDEQQQSDDGSDHAAAAAAAAHADTEEPTLASAHPFDLPLPRSPLYISPSSSPAPAPKGEWMCDSRGNCGHTRSLSTRFSHPITFLYKPPPNGRRPCHFCSNPTYAIVGLGEPAEPLVIEWESGLGFTEIDFGYRKQGFEETRVCDRCTFARVGVLGCADDGGHVVRRMREEEGEEELDEMLTRLFCGEQNPGEMWCSLCVAAASWMCARDQEVDPMGDPVEDGEGMGCGLFLCGACKVGVERFGFEAYLMKMEEDGDGRMARADVTLLKTDGILAKTVFASVGA